MFGVVSALALVGLVSLIIPVLIHLFNPGKGQLVWIGNINLVRLAAKKAVTQRRMTKWLLLLLRLLIFMIATLLLAKTYFNGEISRAPKTLVLFTPQWLEQASESQRKSAWANADEVKQLQIKAQQGLSYWTYVALLDEQRPTSEIFEVYTTDGLSGFDSVTKPQFERTIKWHILPSKVASSTTIKKTAVIYAQQPQSDLLAALNTIKTHRLPSLTIELKAKPPLNHVSPNAHWIFWLSEKPLPDALKSMAAQGSIVIAYRQGPLHRQLWGEGLIVHISPDWNGMMTEPDFANQLMDMMTQLLPTTTRFAGATLSQQQIETSKQVQAGAVDQQNPTPINSTLILLLILLWIGERYMAEKPDHEEAQ